MEMSKQFFSKLSQNYIEVLEDDEYFDITIEVGKDPNKNNDGTLVHIKFPNISPEIFQIILKYIYGGIISLNEQEPLEVLEVLTAADQLYFQEVVEYLQEYLIKNKSEWMEQHFGLVYQTSFQSNSLLELQNFCTDYMSKSPQKIFDSFDFTSLNEKSLIALIKRDDLQMKEIDIWENVLKWGLEKNPTLLSDSTTWSNDDFRMMENTLQHCLPLVRFFNLSPKDFFQKVRPYKKLLNHQLYEELLEFYLNPDFIPSYNIFPPRCGNINENVDSTIVNLNIISLISRWIDNDLKSNEGGLYLPYEFKLLLRGSRDGFTPKKFHELCDNIRYTVTFIKVKETEEIIGGYNPLIWESCSDGKFGKTKDSFIFSFKNGNSFKDPILSHIIDPECALYYHNEFGPTFGIKDFNIYVVENNDLKEYDYCQCEQTIYEKKIRDTEDMFSIHDYEVFQIKRKND
ncbi:hypothetical protein GLOIN_2v1779084 [Rhizophagus clarus]|uniref:TLDc domain-containing protein n=1 Tax=Rhizophagus clarus TaxID=94130 RepID=A0A8H3QV31_9GLOM|nr:hypothetical protein GLOIN_2v1779084 [Rhizophagus clarus]